MNLPLQIPLQPVAARANRVSRVLWQHRRPEARRAAPKRGAQPAFLGRSPRRSRLNRTKPDSSRQDLTRRYFPGRVFLAGRIDADLLATRPKRRPGSVHWATRRKRRLRPASAKLLLRAEQASSSVRLVRCRKGPLERSRDARARRLRRPGPRAKLRDAASAR